MKAPTRILVATDFSAASERALKTAIGLATRFGASITVTHVVEGAPYPYSATPPPWVVESAKAHLDAAVATLEADGLNAWGVLRQGLAWREICSAAAELSPDLVVVGTQGRHGLPRFVLGSVAELVVRQSPVPVLTVHPADDVPVLGGVADRIGPIVAPTDLSEASQRGIDAAATLALALRGSLTLVYVYEVPSYAYYILDDIATEAEATIRRSLDEAVARVRSRLPDVEGVVRSGTPWRGIIDVANERGANMIVLSTHGRRGLDHALLGSVAEKVVRLSPVPVLTLRSK